MDPTLKRRLIGAAILVAIAAIVLPMFLTGPRPVPERSDTLPLDIPAGEDRQTQQLTLPIGRDAADPDPDRVIPVDTGEAGTAPMPTLPPAGSESALPAPATAPSAANATPSAASAATTPPAVTPATPAAGTPASPSQAPATAEAGRFWVNLGSYGQSANADRVVAAARGRNVTVQRETVTTGGRQLIRLRAGPYANRAQAEQARQLLIAAAPDARPTIDEADGVPTADAPASAAAPAAGAVPAAAGAGAWAVQVGAFDQEANARQLSDRLKAAGAPAYVERRGSSYAVRVGPYVRRADAEAQRQQLKTAQKLDGLVVSHRG